MDDSLPLSPATASPALAVAPANPPVLDGHGHDPDAYDWVPVLRKRRADGWSPSKQRGFIEALADTGSVADAARAVHMSPESCYRLRRAPGAESFAAAWTAALSEAGKRLVDIAFERAVNGTYEPLINREGQRVGARVRYSDKLLMFLLRAHAPDRYAREMQASLEVAQAAPVADALRLLEPAPVPDPAALMEPFELETALIGADILDGKLPYWRRDPVPEPVLKPAAEEVALEAHLNKLRYGADEDPEEDDDYVWNGW
jgi:hypothetical protein